MTKLILHVGPPARGRCPHCSSPLPKRGHRVTDEAGVSQFVCRAHLMEFAEVAELRPEQPAGMPSLPTTDDFTLFRYGITY